MNRTIRHDLAQSDLDELAAYIDEESPSTAIRFLDAAEETFRLFNPGARDADHRVNGYAAVGVADQEGYGV